MNGRPSPSFTSRFPGPQGQVLVTLHLRRSPSPWSHTAAAHTYFLKLDLSGFGFGAVSSFFFFPKGLGF